LANKIVTGDISSSYQFLSEYFFKIGKDIRIYDKRLKDDRSAQIIHPLFKELVDSKLEKIEINKNDYDIVIFYASNNQQLEKLKKYTNISTINQVHYYLNNVFLTNSFDIEIFKQLPYVSGFIYISVNIKNNSSFFKEIATSNREELKENERVKNFKEELRYQIINNEELKELNSKKENESDTIANASLTDMLNSLIKEDNENQLYSNSPNAEESKPNAKKENLNDEKYESINVILDTKLRKISIPKNKTVYEKIENFYVKTNISQQANELISPFIKFIYDEDKEINIAYKECKNAKIKYAIEFKNDYDNVDLKVVFTRNEEINCKGTFFKRNLNRQQKLLRKIKGAINFVKEGNQPIFVDLDDDTMRFDINKNFKFSEQYYNQL
jgi:hypothetical protein